MIYWLHLLARRLALAMPLSTGYRVASLIAVLVYFTWHEKRRNAVRNLGQVLGPRRSPARARRLARLAFQNYGRYLVDMLRLSGWQLKEVERRIAVSGVEHVEEALARGKGLIFVGGHLGNSDLGGAWLAGRGYPVHVIAETLQPQRWNDLVQETRRLTGMNVIATNEGVREILRVLRRNEVLAFLVDRPTHREGEGVPVCFFDAWTRVPAGAATLALRTGASLIAACVVRDADGYVVRVSPLLEIERSGDLQADIQRLTQRIMSALEEFIGQYPEQWFMFRAMWPPTPERPALC
jgi:KDO2-lipid IV(A) lauroyltransferase